MFNRVVGRVVEGMAGAVALWGFCEACAVFKGSRKVDWESVHEFPEDFVASWNSKASDSVITPDEFVLLKTLSAKTVGDQDDSFIDGLEDITTPYWGNNTFGDTLEKLLKLNSLKQAAVRFGMNVADIQINISDTSKDRRVIHTGPVVANVMNGSFDVFVKTGE